MKGEEKGLRVAGLVMEKGTVGANVEAWAVFADRIYRREGVVGARFFGRRRGAGQVGPENGKERQRRRRKLGVRAMELCQGQAPGSWALRGIWPGYTQAGAGMACLIR